MEMPSEKVTMEYKTADKRILLGDKEFSLYIPYEAIEQAVSEIADRIGKDYAGKTAPLFLGVLNGSFMFYAELVKMLEIPCEVSFVKLASYHGTKTLGTVSELIGLSTDIKGRDIIVVEDIVDTGESIEYLVRSLIGHEPASIEIATLLFKPESYRKSIPVKYRAFAIPNKFVVGFGMDYNQMGRNLRDIYTIRDGE